MDILEEIKRTETLLASASPKEAAKLVKKLVKLKEKFFR